MDNKAIILFNAALRPVWTLLAVTLAGFVFFRLTRQDSKTLDVLSSLVINIFLPALMISELLKEASLTAFEGWYWLPIAAWVFVAVGFAFGFAFSLLIPAREGHLRPIFANMVAFQNAGYLPLPIVACLFPGNDRMLALVMLFVTGIIPLLWGLSPAIVAGSFGGRGFRWRDVITPPLWAMLGCLALLYVDVPTRLEAVTLGDSNLLLWLLTPFDMAGKATVPTMLIVLGGTLARLLDDGHSGALEYTFARVWLFPSLLVLARLILLPLLGFLLIPRLGLPPSITAILLVETMTPTAMALSVQVRAYGTETQAAIVGRGLLFNYIASLFTLPVWLSVYKLWVEPQLGPVVQ